MLDKESAKVATQAQIDAEPDAATKEQMRLGMEVIDEMTMQFTLNADGTATSTAGMMGQTQSANGKWTISGDTVTITMNEEGSEPATGRLSGDTLELTPPPGSEMPFKLVFKKRAAQ